MLICCFSFLTSRMLEEPVLQLGSWIPNVSSQGWVWACEQEMMLLTRGRAAEAFENINNIT